MTSTGPFTIKVAENGRLSIPAQLRKQLGLEHGGTLVATIDGRELRLRSIRDVIAALQEEVSHYRDDTSSGVDWLLRERRREVAAEKQSIQQQCATEGHQGDDSRCQCGNRSA
jgi:AbrB family looped-hinge helix DNA binding protein